MGRLDTWNMNWMEVEEFRYEIKEYNIDLTLFEYFHSQDQDAGAVILDNQDVLPEGVEFLNLF